MDDFVDLLRWSVGSVTATELNEPHLTDVNGLTTLATILNGPAEYLVTADKALLALGEHYSIITPAEFWARHGDR